MGYYPARVRELVEQLRVSGACTASEQRKRGKSREIEVADHFIGAVDFKGAREQSQAAQGKNDTKAGAA